MKKSPFYLMENSEEAIRLEVKTDPAAVLRDADWLGVEPGKRFLDAGCGPGKTTAILHRRLQPGGAILGLDYSERCVRYAQQHYRHGPDIDFQLHDLRDPLTEVGSFDQIWIRFVLEYNRSESVRIVENLKACLKPGGVLCLIDLDYNCLSHYELSPRMEDVLSRIMKRLETKYNFDPYAGRKLYSYLYDLGFEEIGVDLRAHHLFYGQVKEADIFNWTTKIEVVSAKMGDVFEDYPGGRQQYRKDFSAFFLSPRRFTYTPIILCRGRKPQTSQT